MKTKTKLRLGAEVAQARSKPMPSSPRVLSQRTPPETLSEAVRALLAVESFAGPDQFLDYLNELRREKGLTFDRLGRMCQKRPGLKTSRSGIYTMLTAKQWPTYQQMATFLYLCDISPHEYGIWLTAHARGRGVVDPDFLPESVLLPPQVPPRHGTPRTPPQPALPRPHGLRRWHQRSLLHSAFSLFSAVVVTVTVGVTTLHVVGVPPKLIAMACIAAAFGTVVWTYARLYPNTERRSVYSFGDWDVFEDDTRAAPEVIGGR